MVSTDRTSGRTGRTTVAALSFFLVCLLVLMPDLVWIALANGKYWEYSRPYAVMAGLLPSVALLILVFAAFGARLWIGSLLLLPFLPLVPIEVSYIWRYGEPSWYAMIATALESNSREAADYLGSYLFILVAACAGCLLAGLIATALLKRQGLTWSGKSRSLAVAGVLTAIAAVGVFAAIGRRPNAESQTGSPGSSSSLLAASWMESSFPFGVPLRFAHWYREQEELRSEVDRLRSFRFGARAEQTTSQRQVYVLIIGEAARAQSWSLYGYERDTNPELSDFGNLILLKDVISPWSASRMAVPIITSRKKASDGRMYFNEPSVTRAFAEAGFDTYWMSNQIAFGGYDSPISVVAYDAKHVSFHNVADYSNAGNYDEVLLKPLKEALDSTASRIFIVLHTLGSHENYGYRYPARFDRYKPSLKDVPRPDFTDAALAERIRNSYDNSILYSDHFIAEVIRTVRSEAADALSTVWYVSDHGEDLVSAQCKLNGHGSGTVYNFRVPSVFWFSDSYAAAFPAALDSFRAHSTQPVTTENIFESLIDMAGLDFPGHDRTWSMFSADWRPHRRIVTPLFGQVQLDFDHAGESKNCRMVMPADPGH